MEYVSTKKQMIKAIQDAEKACDSLREGSAIGNEVNAGIRENGISLYEEIAILRKTVALLCDRIGLDNNQFSSYNSLAESIKAEAKSRENGTER